MKVTQPFVPPSQHSANKKPASTATQHPIPPTINTIIHSFVTPVVPKVIEKPIPSIPPVEEIIHSLLPSIIFDVPKIEQPKVETPTFNEPILPREPYVETSLPLPKPEKPKVKEPGKSSFVFSKNNNWASYTTQKEKHMR